MEEMKRAGGKPGADHRSSTALVRGGRLSRDVGLLPRNRVPGAVGRDRVARSSATAPGKTYDLICRNVSWNYGHAPRVRRVVMPNAMRSVAVGLPRFYLLGTLSKLLSARCADRRPQHLNYMVDVTDGATSTRQSARTVPPSFNIGWTRAGGAGTGGRPPQRTATIPTPTSGTTMAGPASAAASPAWTPPPKTLAQAARLCNGSASSWANTPIDEQARGRSGIGRRGDPLCALSPRLANGQ